MLYFQLLQQKMSIRYCRLLLMFSVICLLLICLVFVLNLTAQDGSRSGPSLKLTGPDDEEMLTCSVPDPLPLDTTVWWYVDGIIIDSDVFLRGLTEAYVNLDDLYDLLGHFPDKIQCSISDAKVGYDGVMSNIVDLTGD